MKKLLTILALAAACCFAGCNDDTDDLWDEVNALKSRVEALETQVNVLNDNIEALSVLSQSGITIADVKEEDGTWTLTLSNGDVVTLNQGSDAEAVIPVVGIDAEGYWVVDYRDGAGFVRILVQGEPVKASAVNGTTPRFRIDADSCWEVSYDGGESYEPVLNTDGQPVSAVGSGEVTDKFFADAHQEGDMFHIELLTGAVFDIPVVPDFYCRIIAPDGVQSFSSKETKRFEVEIRGVENVLLSAPDGWSAQLTDMVSDKATLIVTAPETTRALADNTKDVTLLATAGYYACIAKIQVETAGDAVVTPPSVERIAVVADATTDRSLTFTVEVSDDADAWMYLLQESSAAAPEASAVAAMGKVGSGSEATVADLTASTEYVLYAIAIKNPNTYSEVAASEPVSTSDPVNENDYYTVGVEVDGVRYDKNSEGAVLVEVAADAAENLDLSLKSGSIFFIDGKSTDYLPGTSSSQGITSDVIIIGRYADRKSDFRMEKYWALRNPSGTVAFKNVRIDLSTVGNYAFNAAGAAPGGVGSFIFEDCEITFAKPLLTMYNADADSGVGRIVFRNCKFRCVSTDATLNFITLQQITTGLNKFQSYVMENCIVYSTSTTTTAFSLLMQDNATKTVDGSLSNLQISCTNNTFVDLLSASTTTAMFCVAEFGSFTFSKNILWSGLNEKYPSVIRVLHDYNTDGAWPSVEMDRTDSKAWGTLGWKLFQTNTDAFYPDGGNTTFVKSTEDPLSTCDKENGTFVVNPSCAGYGASLE